MTLTADLSASRLAVGAAALAVDFPLVQAGMGGIAVPALAAAVSNAGALGTVALYKSDERLSRSLVSATATATDRTFGINVIPEVAQDILGAQIVAALDAVSRPTVFNSYGIPPVAVVCDILRAGHRLLIQVGTVHDAVRAAELGAQGIALQGVEAGGHHLGSLSSVELLHQVAALDLGPALISAGGVHTGAEVRRRLWAGAHGCLLGTAFIATTESAAHSSYKDAVVAAVGADTVVTDRFSIGWAGRVHRVLRSVVTESSQPMPGNFIAWTSVMGTRRPVPRGSAAAPTVEAEGAVTEMARYAGVGVAEVDRIRGAGAVVDAIRNEFRVLEPATAAPS